MKNVRTLCILLCAVTLCVSLAACASGTAKAEDKGRVYFTYFDTVSYVNSYAGDSAERFEDRSAEVSSILGEYHRLFDIYHEYSGVTNLCTVNSLAGGEGVKVDEKLLDFLLYAKDMYDSTDGEMNVMMGSVLSLWHDCRSAAESSPQSARIPTQDELTEAAMHTGIELLEIDEAAGTVRISDPEASIDVGALGKGYAVERAAEYLRADGAEGYVLNVGGNIRIIGTKPDGSGWVTAVRDPNDPDGNYSARLLLSDTSCVTSGIYERYFTVDGVRYHHIIDRDTLMPAEHYSSITVVTEDSGLADALSTALFCMAYEDALELLQSFDGVDALWIFPDGELRYTPGMEDKLVA